MITSSLSSALNSTDKFNQFIIVVSRLVERMEQSHNDGYRHTIKYIRINQTCQVVIDSQTYSLSYVSLVEDDLDRHSESSVIFVGTGTSKVSELLYNAEPLKNHNLTNYAGCISSK